MTVVTMQSKNWILFLRQCCFLVAPVIWTTCRDANILGLVFYNSLENTSLSRYYTVCLRNILHKTSCSSSSLIGTKFKIEYCCIAVDNNCSPDAAS